MLGPFATASCRTPIHQVSLLVLSHAACASMSTTTTRDRGDHYGPMEWAQLVVLLHQSTDDGVTGQVMLETEQEQTKEKERERQQARVNERLAAYDDHLHTWLFGSHCKLDNRLSL